jgi:hypothetical protein
MPVIVYKTLDLNILYVQGRRILCEFCRQPFTYVLGERKTFNVTGVPMISNDEGMRKDAMKKASAGLAKVAQSKNQGQALCPHCKRYQGWMVRQSKMVGLGCGFLGGIAIAGLLAIVTGIWFEWSSEVIFGVTIGGSILGVVLGHFWSLDSNPQRDQNDQRAIRDDEVPGLLSRCTKDGYEPFLFWYLTLGNKTNEQEALVSLGVADSSGRPPVFPRELNSDFVVSQLQHA